jgi:RNA-directed DNA polymerase
MLEQLLSRENLLEALKRVEANKGSHGVDGMSVRLLREHIKQNWQTIRQAIEEGTYRPNTYVGSKSRNRMAEVSEC